MGQKDFRTISPSAKSLLMMKGHTNIPFARHMAELLAFPEKYKPDFGKKDFTFWARVVHFENRYWSKDQLFAGLPIKNILELSSGFSCRGLETIRQKDVYYIDTDLPDVITTKKELIDLLKNDNLKPKGTLELLHLNALDEQQFQKVVNRFPSGKIAIVNEGLLMYLDMQEKEKLCKIIYNLLKERGGYWITADIYVKKQQEKLKLKINAKTQEFFEQHRIEDNKFESFEEARTFFKKMGFVVDQEAKLKRSQLSSMKYFIKSASLKQLLHINSSKVHVTWRLKIANG